MASYLTNVRLNENIERGALGGGRFNTSVLDLDSGFEKRNVNWSIPLAEFDIGFGLLIKYQLDPTLVKRYAAYFCGTETLREASRDLVEGFVNHLAELAAKDRAGLLCQLNSYAQPQEAKS